MRHGQEISIQGMISFINRYPWSDSIVSTDPRRSIVSVSSPRLLPPSLPSTLAVCTANAQHKGSTLSERFAIVSETAKRGIHFLYGQECSAPNVSETHFVEAVSNANETPFAKIVADTGSVSSRRARGRGAGVCRGVPQDQCFHPRCAKERPLHVSEMGCFRQTCLGRSRSFLFVLMSHWAGNTFYERLAMLIRSQSRSSFRPRR